MEGTACTQVNRSMAHSEAPQLRVATGPSQGKGFGVLLQAQEELQIFLPTVPKEKGTSNSSQWEQLRKTREGASDFRGGERRVWAVGSAWQCHPEAPLIAAPMCNSSPGFNGDGSQTSVKTMGRDLVVSET